MVAMARWGGWFDPRLNPGHDMAPKKRQGAMGDTWRLPGGVMVGYGEFLFRLNDF